jgi:hypothetical protein
VDIRGVYRFSSLVKQNKKAKIYAVFCFAGKRFFFYICDVITSPEKEKSSASHYYNQLRAINMDKHARDFWRIRAVKQQQQVLVDPLLHEHTAVTQYILWHNKIGARLPSFMRGTNACIAHAPAN